MSLSIEEYFKSRRTYNGDDVTGNTIIDEAKAAIANNDAEAHKRLTETVMSHSPSYRENLAGNGRSLNPRSAINEAPIADVKATPKESYAEIVTKSRKAQSRWAAIPVSHRIEFLEILGKKLAAKAEALGFAITSNVGKVIEDSNVEFKKAIEWIKWAATPLTSRQFMPQTGKLGNNDVIHENKPRGIVGVITSFNYPLALSIPGIITGLLTGNSIIFKAASKASHWTFIFQDAFREAMTEFLDKNKMEAKFNRSHWMNNMPDTEFGDNDTDYLTNYLYSHVFGHDTGIIDDVDVLSFVGSPKTANEMRKQRDELARKTGTEKVTHTEEGGNAAVIVANSAFEGIDEVKDIDNKVVNVAHTIFAGVYGNSKQRCTGASLLVLEDGVLPARVFEQLAKYFEESVKVGNPYDPECKAGALVDKSAAERMEKLIALNKKLNGNQYGIGRVSENEAPHGGTYMSPVMLDWRNISEETLRNEIFDEKNGETLLHAIQHETFAPVFHVVRQGKDIHECINIANQYDQEKLSVAFFCSNKDADICINDLLATSKSHNAAPKDLSPWAEHGNFGHHTKTGGCKAHDPYTKSVNYQTPNNERVKELKRVYNNTLGMERAA